ncbi:DUF421 domain-containing protein [Mycolicibacterium novocastrense]|uniref:Membrane protein n=1 Tax=Mycolicibacterium novocastrense TaxID=59813 RepID=A0ABQ0KRT5_MYCNV|nr:hypothetical protein [Mycolicibacterium novocastrense]GAT12314.1 membrane protein [Mycolicibacterium novocastrense]
MSDWQSFFVPAVPLLDGVLRGTVTFLALLVLMRIVGQRESGGLGITDVLIIVLVAEAAAPALYTDETTLIDSSSSSSRSCSGAWRSTPSRTGFRCSPASSRRIPNH